MFQSKYSNKDQELRPCPIRLWLIPTNDIIFSIQDKFPSSNNSTRQNTGGVFLTRHSAGYPIDAQQFSPIIFPAPHLQDLLHQLFLWVMFSWKEERNLELMKYTEKPLPLQSISKQSN